MTSQNPQRNQARLDDPSLDEALREFGRGILNEPIPERLLQALQGQRVGGEAKSPNRAQLRTQQTP